MMPSTDIPQSAASTLIDDVVCASWNEPPLGMSCQDNVLSVDLGMTGLLFKVWESIRIAPDDKTKREAICVMMRYLDTLIQKSDRHFEEYFQYGEMLKSLVVGKRFTSMEKNIIDRANLNSWKRKSA
jgi:hypothetical protein